MSTYADTSFFVSLYLRDQHSSEAERWVTSGADVWLTPLNVAEWTHAIEQHVFRKKLSASGSRGLHDLFLKDVQGGVWIEVSLPESAYSRCIDLARRYTARIGLRTLDTLHVATALELDARSFWTFDERQRKLAKAVGLKIS